MFEFAIDIERVFLYNINIKNLRSLHRVFGGVFIMYVNKKRLVIANPFRFTIFLTIVILMLTFIISNIIILNFAYGNNIDKVTHPERITVQPGDTLWSIVTEYYKGHSVDKRKIIYLIQEANDKTDATIRVGECLILPSFD